MSSSSSLEKEIDEYQDDSFGSEGSDESSVDSSSCSDSSDEHYLSGVPGIPLEEFQELQPASLGSNSLKEYLKRYGINDEEDKKKKKKKKKKVQSKPNATGLLVVDEDLVWLKIVNLEEENSGDSAGSRFGKGNPKPERTSARVLVYRKRMERTQDYLRYCLQIAQENGFLHLIINNKNDQQEGVLYSNIIELQEKLTQGSTADIYRGTWHGLDVVVKCLNPDYFQTLNGNELLGMTLKEWLHGPSKRRKERMVPLPPIEERLARALEIAQAMQYLHGKKPKVIHHDLKPSNIFLDDSMHVRVADFGHARFLNEEEMALTGETGKNLYHFCTIFLLGAL
ncbi:U-box domain-containing protein 51-like [Quercus robur]|uniref:U-box domain-containing protein 51-like n=1 Tax=Quercus robur TaxID=38942 RepID=UPI00216346F0|nr:U-box domain-containing protein 51-like [Quercus robur]